MNTEQAIGAIKGVGTIGAIQMTDAIPSGDNLDVIKVIIQLIVGLGTLWHMWQTRNNNNSTTPKI